MAQDEEFGSEETEDEELQHTNIKLEEEEEKEEEAELKSEDENIADVKEQVLQEDDNQVVDKLDEDQEDLAVDQEEYPADPSLMVADFFTTDQASAEAELDGVTRQDHCEAAYIVRNITSHVSAQETRAIQHGYRPTGPPREAPMSHQDVFAHKFRWPLHLRNLRQTAFDQDMSEILEDYEIFTDETQENANLARLPRPIADCVARNVRASLMRRRSRKRKRAATTLQEEENKEEEQDDQVSRVQLDAIGRLGFRFLDTFLDSLLQQNASALQGEQVDDSELAFAQSCWSHLPVSRRPCANWRFVWQVLAKAQQNHSDPLCPPLKKASIDRIQQRLKTMYGLPWHQDEEQAFFEHTTAQDNEEEQETKEDDATTIVAGDIVRL